MSCTYLQVALCGGLLSLFISHYYMGTSDASTFRKNKGTAQNVLSVLF